MKRILIADDDESVRTMVGRVLESAGYTAVLAGDGREAVAKSRTAPLDLILLDVKMPEQGGWEAFEQISKAAGLTPVIVITAWPNQYEQAVRRGIDALMEKPLDLLLLLQTIEKLLREPQPERVRRLKDRGFTTAYRANIDGVAPGIS